MAGTVQIQLQMNTKLLTMQLGQLSGLIQQLSKRRARRFARKAFCLVQNGRLSGIDCREVRPTSAASQLRFQICVVGLDQLIAAALRASQGKRCV
jgi:hypothetical protein